MVELINFFIKIVFISKFITDIPINSLNLEKNQLLREKEESEKNFQALSEQHKKLKSELENINSEVGSKFGKNNTFNQKIDELNQETETLIDEIEKWQT